MMGPICAQGIIENTCHLAARNRQRAIFSQAKRKFAAHYPFAYPSLVAIPCSNKSIKVVNLVSMIVERSCQGITIWLQTINTNTYVSARTDQSNSPLQASPSQVQDWEKFQVVDAGNGLIAFKANANSLYVSARIDQSTVPLQVIATSVQQWEQFTWSSESNGTFSLRSAANGKYISARSDQSNTPLNGNATAVQAWEQFRWGLVTTAANPDLGPNVFVFDPTQSASSIQDSLNNVFNKQQTNQFGSERFAFLFKPGAYAVDVNLGFYTQAAGLGLLPDAATIKGQVHVEADWFSGNATQNFWRGAENLQLIPPSGTNVWAVAQAAPLRRVDVQGNLQLDDGGWASGGYLGDSAVTGQVRSGSQQQWISRNCQLGSWTGSNWNMVFVGVNGAPGQTFPNPPYTVVNQTPLVREKPFLYIDREGAYQVFVPALRSNTSGTSWSSGSPAGSSLPLSGFFIAKVGDSASKINNALSLGFNLLITPGVYHLSSTLNVTKAGTVVLGLGVATLVPDNGIVPMTVADVDGVSIAGLLFDAGVTNSPLLLQVGTRGSSKDHSANPTLLSDVFFRIGGAAVGKATQSLEINSNNVLMDHTWIWRADHGNDGTVGWNVNTAANGLTVNGNNVTIYGLFVEHYQQYEVIWNGNNGRTYFFQNEHPYDPPSQAQWMNGSVKGFAAYKVADNVTNHEAWGLGSYCFFDANPSVVAERAIETPNTSGVRFHSMVTVSLGGKGSINHVINSTGSSANSSTNVVNLANYP